MAEVELTIAGRSYRVACRDGEEQALRTAGSMVDAKSREALAGLGTLSEARQLLFAALLLADELMEQRSGNAPAQADEALAGRAEQIAERLESLAESLEREGDNT